MVNMDQIIERLIYRGRRSRSVFRVRTGSSARPAWPVRNGQPHPISVKLRPRQEWHSKSVALAPDLPAGYYSWGLALAKHGDFEGAATKLKDANHRGPHWADPLKAWGDVLARQGKSKQAATKYEEALKYAPNWKQLKQARDAAANHKT
jgi:tetratricopeptide (TPR) repeat protein